MQELCPGYSELLRQKVDPILCIKEKCWEETVALKTFFWKRALLLSDTQFCPGLIYTISQDLLLKSTDESERITF